MEQIINVDYYNPEMSHMNERVSQFLAESCSHPYSSGRYQISITVRDDPQMQWRLKMQFQFKEIATAVV